MRHNAHLERVDVPGAGWGALASDSTVLSVEITTVGDTLNMRFADGDGFAIPAGRTIRLRSVDLSLIEISGSSGDAVIVAGGTW